MLYWGLGGLKVKIFLLATEMEKKYNADRFLSLAFALFLSVTYFLNLFSFLQTLRALELLQKFENIAGVQLYLHDKYQRILMQYGRYY